MISTAAKSSPPAQVRSGRPPGLLADTEVKRVDGVGMACRLVDGQTENDCSRKDILELPA
jgi:hypothetical protein